MKKTVRLQINKKIDKIDLILVILLWGLLTALNITSVFVVKSIMSLCMVAVSVVWQLVVIVLSIFTRYNVNKRFLISTFIALIIFAIHGIALKYPQSSMSIETFLFLLLASVCLPFILISIIHELMHLLISVSNGYHTVLFSIFNLTIFSGKIIFGKFGKIGAVLSNYSSVNDQSKQAKFEKQIVSEMLIIYITHLLEIAFAVLLYILCKNIFTLVVLIVTCLYCVLILWGAFDFGNDLYNCFNIKKPYVVCSFLSTCEILNGFANKYLFKMALKYLNCEQEYKEEFCVVLNYYTDYCLYHGIELSANIFAKVMNNDRLLAYDEIVAKFQLLHCISTDTLPNSDMHNKNYINNFYSSMHSIFLHNKYYREYLVRVQSLCKEIGLISI